MGNMSSDTKNNKKRVLKFIRESYLYGFVKRILSLLTTVLLILLLAMGGAMFYFNMQAQAAAKQGTSYVPPFGLYTIISGSMEPNIHVYDVVAAVDVNDLSDIKVGDVITFVSTWDINYGTTVTHRVINITNAENGEYQFTTKGDNNQTADGAVVTRNNLVGKVVVRIPQLGRLQFFLATKAGWFIVVFIPALGVIIWDLIRIFKLKVYKGDVSDIKDTDKAEKTYFDNEILDSRSLDETDLEENNDITPNLDSSPEKKEIKRTPIERKKRTTRTVQKPTSKEEVEIAKTPNKRTVKRKTQL